MRDIALCPFYINVFKGFMQSYLREVSPMHSNMIEAILQIDLLVVFCTTNWQPFSCNVFVSYIRDCEVLWHEKFYNERNKRKLDVSRGLQNKIYKRKAFIPSQIFQKSCAIYLIRLTRP